MRDTGVLLLVSILYRACCLVKRELELHFGCGAKNQRIEEDSLPVVNAVLTTE